MNLNDFHHQKASHIHCQHHNHIHYVSSRYWLSPAWLNVVSFTSPQKHFKTQHTLEIHVCVHLNNSWKSANIFLFLFYISQFLSHYKYICAILHKLLVPPSLRSIHSPFHPLPLFCCPFCLLAAFTIHLQNHIDFHIFSLSVSATSSEKKFWCSFVLLFSMLLFLYFFNNSNIPLAPSHRRHRRYVRPRERTTTVVV